MSEISRPQLAVYVVAALAVLLLGARYLRQGSAGGSGATGGAPAHAPAGGGGGSSPVRVTGGGGGPAVVDVTGAVRRPGVYRLAAGARVQAAVRRAGGVRPGADLSAINLAAKVADGAQVVVPVRGAAGAAATATGTSGAAAAAGGAPAGPVNLNTATAEQLDALDGVGPTMARKIIEYRMQHGGFGSLSELDRIPGIGPKRLAALRGKLIV